MYQAFETDVMDDLFYDGAEGPATARTAYDDFESDEFADEFDDFDAAEEEDDAFIGGLVRGIGQVASGLMGGDNYDGMDEYDAYDGMDESDAYDEYDGMDAYEGDPMDAFEDAMADALDAEDADEFFRRVMRGVRRVANVARQVGRGVGQVARVVGPIASAIPIPQAQAIGRIANVAGRLLADGADEFEALDEMIDMADEEDAIDAASPLIAGLALRAAAPNIARAALPVRRQAVRAVTQSVQSLARRQGAPAARAAVRVTRAVGRRRVPPRAIAPTIRRATAQIARRPGTVRRLSRPLAPQRAGMVRPGVRRRRPLAGARPGMAPAMGSPRGLRRPGYSTVRGGGCPNCGSRRRYTLQGPVTLTIHSH